ncbi:MAG TPA: apolipoprotein N-acyltransferase [Actinomycetes bacterium]|nr:apolipoprotein N-acyltransferase [Actinomycetes bacterium]
MTALAADAPASEPATPTGSRLQRLTSSLGRACVLSAAAGVALALAFPPVGIWVLAPIAVAVLLVVQRRATVASSGRRTAVVGALTGGSFGLTFFALLTPWLLVIGPDAYALIVVMSTGFVALFGAGAVFILRLGGWPLWVACWWVAVEALRDRIPLGGFPWGRIGHSQVDAPTAAWVSVGGVPVLGFVVVLVAGLFAWAVLAAATRRTLPALLVGASACAVLFSGLAIPTETMGREVTVAVVQGNVPDTGLDAFGRREAVLDAHVTATHELADRVRSGEIAQPDVVFWPENASDIDPSLDESAFAAIHAAVADIGVPVLVGMVVETDGGKHVANQGTVWNPTDGPGDTYVKQHLVPFGEYVPMRDLLDAFISRLDRIPRDFVAGTASGVLDTGPVTVADTICYDVAYDSAVREAVADGGEVITVQTNNATYGETAQVDQQWAISRLRALEHGRTVVVASTSGISGIVDPDGTVVTRAPEFEQATIVEPILATTDMTVATRAGAWPEAVLAAAGAVALLVAGVRRRTGRRPT